ncbi:MAG TPA: VWA domain-containing protein [Acidobacteriaceae bacterium]|nr:VWA domain-containing protein [Acidobacteriaceae bacterium]
MGGFDLSRLDMVMEVNDRNSRQNTVESLSGPVSKLDLKAPGAARREYAKGSQLLMKKSYADAADHLKKAISIYPDFVAAHNGLGSAYLYLGKSGLAEGEFSQAVALDDHLPYSYLNLGWAQLALNNFSTAQGSIRKASELAPLDLNLLTALSYAQLLNRDYAATIATAHQVHSRKHEKSAIVHYFAAAAWQGENNLEEAQNELQIFLDEAPQSPSADAARRIVDQIKNWREHPRPSSSMEIAYSASPLEPNATVGLPTAARRALQQIEQQNQLAEVESVCETCPVTDSSGPFAAGKEPRRPLSGAGYSNLHISPYTLRSTVNEVAVFFAVTDHGKSVNDLTQKEVEIRDAGKAPATVLGFRNEAQLPLRLGLVIDTSNSITQQFAFEQKAAGSFLKKSLTGKGDLAFVVGFSNAVLLVRDFTGDSAAIAEGINQLAPGGGTALWDAVKFASDKLAGLAEEKPVARILVVISDGEDNSSSATLKEAIEAAERHEITVYTVSTRELAGGDDPNSLFSDRAMRALAERTGGAAFFPGSLGNLDHRLSDLQQVLRSRYLISYKPDQFEADGSYRSIAVVAHKSGRKLRVYARRGYYAPNGKETR